MALKLVIGNKNYSSWSMRPWLALRANDIAFEEIFIPLYTGDADKQRILDFTRSGKVPALIDGDVTVWDSLAIIEYLAERFPRSPALAGGPAPRARARSISAEMHSGFVALRNECGMNLHRPIGAIALSADARANVARVQEIWTECRERYGKSGPFLFGAFGGADAMFAPVVHRFRTYAIAVSPGAGVHGNDDGVAGLSGMDPRGPRRNSRHREIRDGVSPASCRFRPHRGLTAARESGLNLGPTPRSQRKGLAMGILDSLENSPAFKGALGQLESAVLPVVLSEVLGNGSQGGLNAIVAKLQQAGLGDQVKSWIGNGQNLPITAEQLQQVLGSDTVKQLAAQFNIPVDQIAKVLAQQLPKAVDHASPDGKLPHTA